jgi:hypothetical protein
MAPFWAVEGGRRLSYILKSRPHSQHSLFGVSVDGVIRLWRTT